MVTKEDTKKSKPKKEEVAKEEDVVKAKELPKTSEVKEEPKAEEATKPKRKPSKKKPKEKAVTGKGKRKSAIARATVKKGNGIIRVNRQNLDSFNNRFVREIVKEATTHVGPEANNIDISVNVFGGGTMGQAQAARTAIAVALAGYFEDMKLKEKFMDVDRSLVVSDPRRVESKKWKGPKARARYQKSYR